MGCALTDSPLDRPIRGGPIETGRAVRCGGCGRAYELRGWLALALVGILTDDAIATHVVKWPLGVRIEIRRCARCGRSIARTVEAAGA